MDKSFIVYRGENIIYATIADDHQDACYYFRQNRNDEEWNEIIKIKEQYTVGELNGITIPFERLNLDIKEVENVEELANA